MSDNLKKSSIDGTVPAISKEELEGSDTFPAMSKEELEELKKNSVILASFSFGEDEEQKNVVSGQEQTMLTLDANEMSTMLKKASSKQDLLDLLNYASKVVFGESTKPYTMRMLNLQAYSSINPHRYHSFQIPKKKAGEFRQIDAPNKALKSIQQVLNNILQTVHQPHHAAMGFVQGRSVATNARVHVGMKYVYNIDLKDFFPSITSGRIHARLKAAPFSINDKVASMIADLCCNKDTEGKSVLPQGAPTSPTLTNIICENLDKKLSKLASVYGLRYTRYADDITFSGMYNAFEEGGKFLQSMRHIVEEEEHFHINPAKTRLTHRGMRQEVTGLTVNEKPNVSRTYVKQLRTMLHIWEKQGLAAAQESFEKHYTPKVDKTDKPVPHIENVIGGKLLYMKMVKGGEDSTFQSLKSRYLQLTSTEFSETNKSDIWPVKRGVETSSDDVLLKELEDIISMIDS